MTNSGLTTPYLCFDTETKDIGDGINVYLIGSIFDGLESVTLFDTESFIIELCERTPNGGIAYAHNTGFDVPIIFFDNELPEGVEIKNVMAINSSLFLTIAYKDKVFEIRDSASLLQGSLKSLCTDFEVSTPKLDFDFNAWRAAGYPITDELIVYNRIDCVALYQVLERAFDLFEHIGVNEIKITLASTAFNYLINQTYDGDIIGRYTSKLPAGIEKEARITYFGGRTEGFFQGEATGVKHID